MAELIVRRGMNFPTSSGIVGPDGRRPEIRREVGDTLDVSDLPPGTDIERLIARGVVARNTAEVISASAPAEKPKRTRTEKAETA